MTCEGSDFDARGRGAQLGPQRQLTMTVRNANMGWQDSSTGKSDVLNVIPKSHLVWKGAVCLVYDIWEEGDAQLRVGKPVGHFLTRD